MRQKICQIFVYFAIFVVLLVKEGYGQQILNKNETFYVKPGDTVVLPCKIKDVLKLTNDEGLSVAWSQGLHDGLISSDGDLQDESGRYEVVLEKDEYKLIILSVTAIDAKQYVCTSSSEDNMTYLYHTVIIGEPPVVSIIGEKDKTIVEGEEFVLECQVSGKPTPIVKWSYQNGPLPGVTIIGNKLQFKKAKKEFSGNYICSAKNNIGSSNITSKIMVVDSSEANEKVGDIEEPVKVYGMPEKHSIEFGKEMNLSCKYTAYPEATVEWTHNGRAINSLSKEVLTKIFAYQEGKYTYSVLNINSFHIANIGSYKCIVKNDRGNDSKVFNIVPVMPEVSIDVLCNTLHIETTFKGEVERVRLYWKTSISSNFDVLTIYKEDFEMTRQHSNGLTITIDLTDLGITRNSLIDFEVVLESSEYGDFKSSKSLQTYVFDEKNPGKLAASEEYKKCIGSDEPSSGERNNILFTPLCALLFVAFVRFM
uniref:Neurotrimin-like n=1 Tax=Parastrongyloides trichosuri TaxID=131310 RepID=A0A0N5A3V3_PARTI